MGERVNKLSMREKQIYNRDRGTDVNKREVNQLMISMVEQGCHILDTPDTN